MWKSALLLAPVALAIDISFDSADSIREGAATIAQDMMSFYKGHDPGETVGILPGGLECNPEIPGVYCWWQAGAMWGGLINYWQYTGDDTYNQFVIESIQAQRGPDMNFNPPNQSRSMGIDDQAFWAFTALDAAEANFPESEVEGDPSYLSLAQGLFNFQTNHWDSRTCGGGFRWQVIPVNSGYHLKNMISNGGNFQVAARLAYITGNETYADWATMVWDWMADSLMFDRTDDELLYIWDNVNAEKDCGDPVRFIWSYNYGVLLAGAAYMYNHTEDAAWKERVDELLASTMILYFPEDKGGNTMVEYLCEEQQLCNQDQKSFKAYLTRWLAVTALLVPDTWDTIYPKLMSSAAGAAGQCTGGTSGTMCSQMWYTNVHTGQSGVGEQVSRFQTA